MRFGKSLPYGVYIYSKDNLTYVLVGWLDHLTSETDAVNAVKNHYDYTFTEKLHPEPAKTPAVPKPTKLLKNDIVVTSSGKEGTVVHVTNWNDPKIFVDFNLPKEAVYTKDSPALTHPYKLIGWTDPGEGTDNIDNDLALFDGWTEYSRIKLKADLPVTECVNFYTYFKQNS